MTTASTDTTRAVLYLRISLDKLGEGAGVDRQRQACQELAARNGWEVTREYVDNSVSAYSGRVRPKYQAMLAAIRAGEVDRVISWHPDRLHRRPIELNEYIDLTERAGVTTHSVTAGHWDLSTPSGRVQARIMGDLAAYESEHKAERVRAQMKQAAHNGQRRGTAQRLYGYTQGKAEIIDAEAAHLRRVVDHILAGGSLRRAVKDLNAAGARTTKGREFTTDGLRAILLNPAIAGLATWNEADRHGKVVKANRKIVGPAQWEAIIPEDTWRSLTSVLQDPARVTNHRGNTPAWLGSGIYLCGHCRQAVLNCRNRPGKTGKAVRVYYAKAGGGHVTRVADQLDQYVTEAVITRLSQLDVAEYLASLAGDTDDRQPLAQERERLLQRRDALESEYESGQVPMDQFLRMNARLVGKLEDLDARLAELAGGGGALTEALSAEDVAAWWFSSSLDLRRELLRAVVDVYVMPVARGTDRFLPEHVELEWKI